MQKARLAAGFRLPAAPRAAGHPVPVAPDAHTRPAAGRLRRWRVIIGSRIIGVWITPAPTVSQPASKAESGTPTAAPTSMPVAAIPARLGTAGCVRKETEH